MLRRDPEKFMNALSEQKCKPCAAGTPPLKGKALDDLAKQLEGWHIAEGKRLEKEYKFKDFREALDFTNQIGEVAEAEGHHPDIFLTWGKVKLVIWTHSAGGLTESDFVLAAKADTL
jgi:4a-hydroxytetrahydrobiopterin dehydratase